MRNIKSTLLFVLLSLQAQCLWAQDLKTCGASETIAEYCLHHPEAEAGQADAQAYARQHMQLSAQNKSSAVDTYRIAVVFHIYGTNQGGILNDSFIKAALKDVNDDFQGLNPDFNSVHVAFLNLRGAMNIKFCLAQKDTNGNPTTGIIYHPYAQGYAYGLGYDSLIQIDAWDNYKYMNVYVQYGIFAGDTNTAGAAFYPFTSMSDANLARVCFNGRYLGPNVDPSWAHDILTHEFGHFLNLMHTFDGTPCTMPNDMVGDTPPCYSGQGCHPSSTTLSPLNCNNQLVNAENYMDYNNICDKMFTLGQVSRMDTAMHHPARITLWQDSTVIATGIYDPTSVSHTKGKQMVKVYPNPSHDKIFVETSSDNNSTLGITISNITGSKINAPAVISGRKIEISLDGNPPGIYFIQLRNEEVSEVLKVELL